MADDFSASLSTTGSLVLGEYKVASIDMQGDQDWFRVSLEAGKTYRVDVEGRSADFVGQWNVNLGGIYDDTGLLIPGTTNFDGGDGRNARLFFTPTTTDTYFVSAGVAPTVRAGFDSAYRVRITDNWDDFSADASNAGSLARAVASGANSFTRTPFVGSGTSDWQGDRDWHAVALEAGQRYSVLVDALGADGHIYGVFDPSGAYIPGTSDADSGVGLGALAEFTATVSGTYHVSAGLSPGGNGKGTYSVAVYEDDYPEDISTSGHLTAGGTVSGNIFRRGDRDWFAIDLEAGQHYTFVMDASFGVISPKIHSIRDATGERFVNTSASGPFLGEAVTDFVAPENGRYFVDVAADFSARFQINPYTLKAVSNELSDDVTTQGRILVDGSLRSSLDYRGDRDWVAVDFVAGETYRVTMSGIKTGGGTLVDPLIYSIRDANGVHITGTSSRGGPSGDPEVWFTATETGTHFIDAREGRDSGSSYTLRVQSIVDDFGSDAASAGALIVGGSVSGSIDAPTDTDWFAAALVAGETYRVRVLGQESGDGTILRPLLAGIYEPDGDLVPFTVQAGTGASRNTEWFYTATESGIFHFAAGGHLNHRGTYVVELTQMLTLRGTEEDDWLTVPGNAELRAVHGSTGRDMLSFAEFPGSAGQGVAVDLDADTATLFAASSRINLFSIEDVTGSLFDDVFRGSDRAEIFRGLGGNDLFFGSDGGVDVYDGGGGSDTLSFALSDAAVRVSLLRGTGWSGDARGDKISGIENLIGTSHDDFIWGDHGINRLEGGAGDDTLVGNDGDDYILGGNGTDTAVFSGNQSDYSISRSGLRTDVIDTIGNDGHDVLGHVEILRFADGELIL